MLHVLNLWFMDPTALLHHFGGAFFWVSLAIIFIECGLLFPFLPGDSLLFAIGLFSVTSVGFDVPLWQSIPLLMVAAFAGNVSGYEIGRRIGPALYKRDGRILKKKYFDQTHAFFDKHGSKALVIGRFVPIVRTFITVVAGVGQMERRRFFTWSAVGSVLWVGGVTAIGASLGKIFPWLGGKLDLVIVVIIAVSLIPVVVEWFRHRRGAQA